MIVLIMGVISCSDDYDGGKGDTFGSCGDDDDGGKGDTVGDNCGDDNDGGKGYTVGDSCGGDDKHAIMIALIFMW